jgi:hypothetical protein
VARAGSFWLCVGGEEVHQLGLFRWASLLLEGCHRKFSCFNDSALLARAFPTIVAGGLFGSRNCVWVGETVERPELRSLQGVINHPLLSHQQN